MARRYSETGTGVERNAGHPLDLLKTITPGGHHAPVKAFLMKYYGEGGQWASCDCPTPTLTCNDDLNREIQALRERISALSAASLPQRQAARSYG